MSQNKKPTRFPFVAAILCPKCKGTMSLFGNPIAGVVDYVQCDGCSHILDFVKARKKKASKDQAERQARTKPTADHRPAHHPSRP